MVDPVSGALVAAAKAAGSEAANDSGKLLQRALGPTADVIGQALAQYAERRLTNVGRIVGRSESKSKASGRTGTANMRVAHEVLESGSYCDDELMADYFGGVLAAARTPDGRDDRAVVWSKTVSGLSAVQVRLHYLVYRELAYRLAGRTELNLGTSADLRNATVDLGLAQMVTLLTWPGDDDRDVIALLSHAVAGLHREGLIGNPYAWGRVDQPGLFQEPLPPFHTALRVEPSVTGLELYGWAQGDPEVTGGNFTGRAKGFELDPPIPRVDDVHFPYDAAATVGSKD